MVPQLCTAGTQTSKQASQASKQAVDHGARVKVKKYITGRLHDFAPSAINQ